MLSGAFSEIDHQFLELGQQCREAPFYSKMWFRDKRWDDRDMENIQRSPFPLFCDIQTLEIHIRLLVCRVEHTSYYHSFKAAWEEKLNNKTEGRSMAWLWWWVNWFVMMVKNKIAVKLLESLVSSVRAFHSLCLQQIIFGCIVDFLWEQF